ncbi:MAG: OmpA family protein [Ignavibacteria bacterium]|nr:OmpA family protein [Ignavibacteria bacterium]
MKLSIIVKLLFVLLFLVNTVKVLSQTSIESLQKEAKNLSSKSLTTGGSVFAESDFKKAEELLADADELIKENKKPEKAIENLNQAIELYKKTIESAKSKSSNFTSLMKTRELVLIHGLSESTLKIWKEAEDNFVSAYEEFEDKDTEGVIKYSNLSEKLYKDAELVAIKDQYLLNVKAAFAKAEDGKLEKFTPKTVAKIKQYIADAENVLTTNRYDTLAAKKVLNSAFYEINHGIYMQGVFTKMQDEDKTWEDLQLLWEEPIAKIATDLKLFPAFDTDNQNVTSNILQSINVIRTKLADSQKEAQNLKAEIVLLKKSLDEAKTELASSKSENQKLTQDLEGAKKANENLTKAAEETQAKLALMEQENVKFKADSETSEKNLKLIENISTMFLPSEAEVIKSGDLLTIRLVNLNFPTNKATLEPQYFSLLNKIQKAIQTFPNGTVVIEGHTDGVGDYQKNIELSQNRSNSVYQYLMSTMGADAARITVVGLGGTKPIANNSSEEGRAKNRRIEVVINPHLELNK